MKQVKRIDIRSRKDMEIIKEEWVRLESGKDMTVFQSYAWNRLLVESWCEGLFNRILSNIAVYCLQENGEEVLLMIPVQIQKYTEKNRWWYTPKGVYLLGHGTYTDYLCGIYDQCSEADILFTLETIHRDYPGMSLFFESIKEETFFSRVIAKAGRLGGTETSISVKRMENAEVYRKSLSKHVRQKLRTAHNRMERDGVVYELKVTDRADPKLIERLRSMHTERLRVKNWNNRDLLRKLSSMVRIKICIWGDRLVFDSMKNMENSVWVIAIIDGQIAGYLYGLKDRRSIRIMHNCVNMKFGKYSPMFRAAFDFILQMYEELKVDEVDFTCGTESYKYQLGGIGSTLRSYLLFP